MSNPYSIGGTVVASDTDLSAEVTRAEVAEGTSSSSLGTLSTTVASHTTSLSSLGTSISSLGTTLGSTGSSLTSLAGTISGLGTTVTSHTTSLSSLGTSISSLGATLSSTSTSLGTLGSKVASLVPTSAALLASNSAGSLVGLAVGPNLYLNSGTLSAASGGGAALPAAAPLLATNANGTATSVTIGSNLALTGGTLSASGTLTGNASAQTITATAATTTVALADLAARTVYPEDFGAKGDGTTDDAPAFQAAHNALISSYGSTISGGIIQCRASRYLWNSPVVVTQNITIRGVGSTDGPQALSGTTFVVNNPNIIPLTVTSGSTSPRGFRFLAISWEHAQSYGASPFIPVDYPPAILVANTYGGFLIDDVTFKGATRGILALNCGHFEIRKVIGQVFRYLVSIDACYDTPKIDYLRCWTYVANTNAIEAYCQANTTVLEVARCDGIDLGTVFAFSHMSVAHAVMGHQVAFAPTAAVASGATTVPLADTSGLCAGMTVMGSGIPPGTTIAAVVDATHVTLSTATVLAMGTVAPLVFGCYRPTQLLRTAGSATLPVGSTTIALTSTNGLWLGQNIVAEFLPLTAVVTSISSSAITVSQPTSLAAPVSSAMMFGTGFPTALATASAATSAATTLTVSGVTGTLVPNMRFVSALRGLNVYDNVANRTPPRVLSVSGSTVTLDTAVTVASGAALIFQMPPAGNTGGGVPQYDAHSLAGDRCRFMAFFDGLNGRGTKFYLTIDNVVSGGEDSSQSTGSGTPLDLAYGMVLNADLGACVRVKTLTVQQYSTSAVRVGGGSANHLQIGHASTAGLDINQTIWGERPLFNIEGSLAAYAGYPNSITIEDLINGAPNGGPVFNVPSGTAAMGFCHRYVADNGGTTLFGLSSGSYVVTMAGNEAHNVGGQFVVGGLTGQQYVIIQPTQIVFQPGGTYVLRMDVGNTAADSGVLVRSQVGGVQFIQECSGTEAGNLSLIPANGGNGGVAGPLYGGFYSYATLPSAPPFNGNMVFCTNARVNGQAAGSGTGCYVQSTAGTWLTMAGTPITI